MPTSTFFRLPEEKRSRLMKAVWKEFTRVSYAEASINRIILGARIPRGSFYQYFEDKNDLFFYLLDIIREKFLVLLGEVLGRTEGDLFAVPTQLFDAIITPEGKVTPRFEQGFRLLALNVNMGVQQLFFDRAAGDLQPEALLEHIAPDCLRSREAQYVGSVFWLLVGALADAIAQILSGRGEREKEYETLKLRVEIIRAGSGKGDAK